MYHDKDTLTDNEQHRRNQGTFTAKRFLNGPRSSRPSTITPPPTCARPQTETATDPSSLSSVSVTPECITAFNDLKLGKSTKWIIFKLSDDYKEIVVEETSTEANYEVFRNKLTSAKSKDRKGNEGIGGRYAVYDVEYDAPGGEGKRNKITFISYVPDDAAQYVSAAVQEHNSGCGRKHIIRDTNPTSQPRMMYSSSKDALKRALNGIAIDVQANDADDIEHDSIIKRASTGR